MPAWQVAIGAKKMVTFAESLLSLTRTQSRPMLPASTLYGVMTCHVRSRISVANDALDRAEERSLSSRRA